MVSLCQGMVPDYSSLIVITCINVMRMIRIDGQMIAKDKIWILLYNDFVVIHSASLEEKQLILVKGVDVPWFHST